MRKRFLNYVDIPRRRNSRSTVQRKRKSIDEERQYLTSQTIGQSSISFTKVSVVVHNSWARAALSAVFVTLTIFPIGSKYAPLYFLGFFRASGEVAAITGVPAPCVGFNITARLNGMRIGRRIAGKSLSWFTTFSGVEVDVRRIRTASG